MNTNDLWEKLGSLEEEQALLVLYQLFEQYEKKTKNNPTNQEAMQFFNYLQSIISQIESCNINRR
jgi:hypothetical protein